MTTGLAEKIKIVVTREQDRWSLDRVLNHRLIVF